MPRFMQSHHLAIHSQLTIVRVSGLPHHENAYEVWSDRPPVNAIGRSVLSLMHDDSHLGQIEDIVRQAHSAQIEEEGEMSEEPRITLGVGMAVRDFDCLLCGQPFSRLCGDLIVPEYQVCDECLAKVNHLQGRELWAYIDQNRIDSKEKPKS